MGLSRLSIIHKAGQAARCLGLLSALTLFPALACADDHSGHGDLARMASDPYWQRLLRDPTPDDGHYASPVDKPGFFLSDQGARDAGAELSALLTALRAPWSGKPDEHPACRFPARTRWLAGQLPAEAARWPAADCPALTTWLQALDTAQITLVFASDYLNNPSSMFGHTLLRLDAHTQSDDTRLLAYAINYSAQTNTSNGLEFAIKGLTGGYPGAFSLLPYYEKVKEYNDWESRDLWEYELDLSQAEVDRVVLSQWEWRAVTSPYYFLSRNCSFELLGLIEMARPGLRLQAQFPVDAIPTDTLRAVLAQPGLLKRVTWRAASGTRQQADLERNDRATNRAALLLMEDPASPVLATLTPTQQARALETAYDDLYSRYVAREAARDTAPPRLRQLLTRRSQVPVPDQRVEPVRPAVDPANGHGTRRVSFGLGRDDENIALLHFRPAYHDWLDPSGGYREGARIDFLSGTLRLSESGLGIQDATVVGIDSLAPANGLRQPLSWSVRLGVDQALGDRRDDDRHHGMAVFEGGGGMAARAGRAICHAQSHSDVRGSRGLDKGWEIGTGARLGCIGPLNMLLPAGLARPGAGDARWLLETRPMYRWPDAGWSQELRTGLQLPLAGLREQALRLELRREWRDDALTSFNLSWLRYF